ncbi:MAG: hypothetical protein DMF77_15595 [Acidobacteria bacterium]|nr:MAG: hypothetical protein DMF77_15595 [Acidobacteriota bacterium]
MGARGPVLAVIVLLAGSHPRAAADEIVTVRGRVKDATSGLPVAGAEVAAGETRGVTDAAGSFALSLARGRWTVSFRAPGYLEETRRVTIAEETLPPLDIALVPKARFFERVEVKATPAPPAEPGALPVTPDRVLTVAGGLDNIFHVIQTLPGVVATDELGSRISVRGGLPDENLTIMDGVEIHNRFDFSPGGFGVSHGDRLSSLLVVENRDGGAKKVLSGSSALSITDANVILEGKLPVRKGSWLLTTRRTYYDLVAERFVDAQLPAFNDVQLRVAWEPKDGQKLSLTGVRSREDGNGEFTGDVPDESGNFLLGVRNDLVSAAFQARVGAGVSRTTLAWYGNTSVFDAAARFRPDTRRSNTAQPVEVPLASISLQLHHDIRDFSGRQEVSLPIGSKHTLDTGFDVHRLRAGITYLFEGDRNPSAANGSSVRGGAGVPDILDRANRYVRGGAWLEDRFRLTDALTVVPGLRLDASGMNDGAVLSPRLSATVGLGRSTRLRAAGGLYTQSPGYEKLIVSDYLVDQVDLDFEHARRAWRRITSASTAWSWDGWRRRREGRSASPVTTFRPRCSRRSPPSPWSRARRPTTAGDSRTASTCT